MNVPSFATQVCTWQEAEAIAKYFPFSKSLQHKQTGSQIPFQGQAFWFLILAFVSQVFSKSWVACLKATTAKNKDHIKEMFGSICVFYHFQKTRS